MYLNKTTDSILYHTTLYYIIHACTCGAVNVFAYHNSYMMRVIYNFIILIMLTISEPEHIHYVEEDITESQMLLMTLEIENKTIRQKNEKLTHELKRTKNQINLNQIAISQILENSGLDNIEDIVRYFKLSKLEDIYKLCGKDRKLRDRIDHAIYKSYHNQRIIDLMIKLGDYRDVGDLVEWHHWYNNFENDGTVNLKDKNGKDKFQRPTNEPIEELSQKLGVLNVRSKKRKLSTDETQSTSPKHKKRRI
eukprot:509478_1